MSDYNLIQSLQTKPEKTPLPPGKKYSEHVVVVEGNDVKIHIPTREEENLTRYINENQGVFDKYNFNKMMRDLRGIRG